MSLTPPELTEKQKKFLDDYLDNIDWNKVNIKELIRELMITQVLRDPDAPKGGKYDIFCGHNRSLAYILKKAEIIEQPGSGGILEIYHVDDRPEALSEKGLRVKKIRINTDGGSWEFKIGGTISDPDEFDWKITSIEVLENEVAKKIKAILTKIIDADSSTTQSKGAKSYVDYEDYIRLSRGL